MTMDRIKAYVARKTKGLGSLVSAVVIVMGVLSLAVYSLAAGPMRDSDEAMKKALGTFADNARTSQLFLSSQGLDKPASYLASINTHGWKNREELVIDASVLSVRSLDASVASASKRSSFSAQQAISDELTGKRVLAAVDPRVASALPEQGVAKVRLVVKPQGTTAALVIDEVIEPAHLAGAATVSVRFRVPTAAPVRPVAPVVSATAPVVDELSAYHGAPGRQIVAKGARFGATQGASWVSCGGVRATVVSWSSSQVTFVVPSGMKKAGYVGVVVASVPSNGLYFEPFDDPVLTSITPNDGAPGSVVTLTGRNFGPEKAGWVTFAGATAEVVSWSDTSIQVLVPRSVASGYAGVVTHGMTSNGMFFAPYGRPLVTSFDRRLMGPGDTVTISGRGISGSSMVALGGMLITPEESGAGWVRFVVPDNAHSGYLGVLRPDGSTSNGLWACVAPKVQSLSSWWARPGSTITLTGRGFNGSAGYEVYVGHARARVVSLSATQITAVVPNVLGAGYVGVGTPAACSNGLSLLVVDPGSVSGVSASTAKPGDLITITGSGFGSAADYKRAHLGGAVCEVTSWSDSAITIVVPAGASSGYAGVTQYGASTNGVWVNVQP